VNSSGFGLPKTNTNKWVKKATNNGLRPLYLKKQTEIKIEHCSLGSLSCYQALQKF
jgi:hypothetical protein